MNIASIEHGYDITRIKNERERERRIALCASRDPGIPLLLDELNALKSALIKSVLLKEGGDIQGEIKRAEAELAKRLKAVGLNGDYLDPVYDCPVCKDTGYVEGERCACYVKKLSASLEEGGASFDAFDTSLYEGAAQVKDYFSSIARDYPRLDKRTYIISGQPGVGKTYILKCLRHEFIKASHEFAYCLAYDMFSAFHSHRLGRDADISPYFDAPALFIDDLGSEIMTKNVTVEYFSLLMSKRHESGRFTFITTNFSDSGLLKRYGERTASRLFDSDKSSFVVIKGKDLRLSPR